MTLLERGRIGGVAGARPEELRVVEGRIPEERRRETRVSATVEAGCGGAGFDGTMSEAAGGRAPSWARMATCC
jgi:hypothetical protein